MEQRGYIHSLLGDREQILLKTRQHWFVLLQLTLLEIVVIAIIIVAVSIALVFNPLIAIAYALLVIPLATGLRDYLNWHNRVFIITNRRVIQVNGIYNKNVIDSSLEKVNDVHMTQSIWGRMFGFGDIEILTASEAGINLFRRIGDPIKFKTVMLNAKVELEHEPMNAAVIDHSHDIPYLIAELDKLRQRGVLSDVEFEQKKQQLLTRL